MNRRTDMNEPNPASSCLTLCSQGAQNQAVADKVGLFW